MPPNAPGRIRTSGPVASSRSCSWSAAEVAALVSLAPQGGIRGGLVLVAVASASRVVPIVVTIVLGGLRPAPTTTLGAWFADRVTLTDAVVALVSAAIVIGSRSCRSAA